MSILHQLLILLIYSVSGFLAIAIGALTDKITNNFGPTIPSDSNFFKWVVLLGPITLVLTICHFLFTVLNIIIPKIGYLIYTKVRG